MKQPNRRLFFVGLILIALVVLLLDPADITNRVFTRRRPPVPPEMVSAGVSLVQEQGADPSTFVLHALEDHRVVFLGEFPQIAEHPRFLTELIPQLPEHGIHAVGVDFALARDQELIDRLTTGPEYDEDLALRILRRRLPIWGYREYAEVFRAAWELNRGRPETDRIRLIGLNVMDDQRPTQLPPEERPTGAELGRALFPNGLPDRGMARTALQALENIDGPLLLYAGARHAFTRFRDLEYETRMAELGFPDARRAGNILQAELGEDIITVYLHGPWPDEQGRNGLTFAAGGLIDTVVEEIAAGRSAGASEAAASKGPRFAIPISGTPLAEHYIEHGDYAKLRDGFSFGDLTDAYVVLAPTGELSAATPIEGFIAETNIESARAGFPGHLPQNAEPRDINAYIARVSANLDDILEGFD
ncbi:MAG: hypothetical protein GVY14_04025 [Spirochaetes bacterium]|jgi:hypothetical protein|nr:hypothetical protein [Spirochaetota bacterium]